MYKPFEFKSIHSSIMAGILGVSVLILVVTLSGAFYFANSNAEENAKDYTYKLIEQVDKNIEFYLKDMSNIANAVAYNYDISDYLSRENLLSPAEKIELKKKIDLEINGIKEHRQDITTIGILGFNEGQVISPNKPLNKKTSYRTQAWYEKALQRQGRPSFSTSHVQNIYKGDYPWVVTMSQELYDIKTHVPNGVVFIDLNYKTISQICSGIQLGDRGYIYIIDSEGAIVYHPAQRLINSKLINEQVAAIIEHGDGSFHKKDQGEEKIYTVKTSNYSGWKIVGVSYVAELVDNKSILYAGYLILFLLVLVVTFIVSEIISSTLSKPIKELQWSMQTARKNNLEAIVEVKSQNEVGLLSHTFNMMTQEIKALIEEKERESEEKRKNEMKALQHQINPHFLYNTLDSIIWMSMENKNEDVIQMTSALAKMFRLSISKGNAMITLEEEMAHVENYLVIQKYRYGKKLDYKLIYEGDIGHYKVLKLLLQPLVENSIYHGIKNQLDKGTILIKGETDGQYLYLKVIDDGAGMSQQTLDNIFKEASASGNGVGVNNVNERVALYFGRSYGLTYESEIEEGTTATIKLPIIDQEEA